MGQHHLEEPRELLGADLHAVTILRASYLAWTLTAELVQRGELSEEDALDHPQHKVLTRVLGGGPDVEPDSVLLRARDGDRLLLCTDGLVNEVGKDQIAPLLASAQDGASAADALVELAVSNGGQDNVSVVVIDVLAPPTGC
jgi:protein phosphatase